MVLGGPSIAADQVSEEKPRYICDIPTSSVSISSAPTSSFAPPAPDDKQHRPAYIYDLGELKPPEAGGKRTAPAAVLRVHLGQFQPDGNGGKLLKIRDGFGLGIELGIKPKDLISYRIELMSVTREYETPSSATPPVFGTIDNRMYLDTNALLVGIRAAWPKGRSYRLHATAGFGYFATKLTVDSSVAGIPAEISESDSSLGLHAGIGAELDTGTMVIGLEFRHWFVDGSFSTFGIGSVDLGGNYYGLSAGWYF